MSRGARRASHGANGAASANPLAAALAGTGAVAGSTDDAERAMPPAELAELQRLVEVCRLSKQRHADIDDAVGQLEEQRREARLATRSSTRAILAFADRVAAKLGLDTAKGWFLDPSRGVFVRAPAHTAPPPEPPC